jgi:sec-independent protein translocase protein TatB
MFDISWSHLMAIAIVALLVIGPKDLPRVLRALGRWAGKARAIAREFQSSIDQMIRESELDEVRKEVEQVASTDIAHEIQKSADPTGELQTSLQSGLTDAVNNPAASTATATSGAGEATAPPAETATHTESAPSTEPGHPAKSEPEKTPTAA